MKNFGIIKSKIEKILVESYQNKTIKESFSKFREIVLKDKDLVSMFYLYDQLSTKSGIKKDIANDYINESIDSLKKLKISKQKTKELLEWVSDVECNNNYETIDKILDENVLNLESKIKNKKLIFETITTTETKKEFINIPLKTSLNIANQSMQTFLQNLSESDKQEFLSVAKLEPNQLIEEYNELKNSTISKLELIKESSNDVEITEKISETILKIQNENVDKLNLYRLRKLNETI